MQHEPVSMRAPSAGLQSELGISSAAPTIADAICDARGTCVREFPNANRPKAPIV
jgi:hypothetical protein